MKVNLHKVSLDDVYEYTKCHISCWRSAYKGIVPDEYLEKMPQELEQRVDGLAETINSESEYMFYYVELEGKMIGRLIIGKSRDKDKPNAGEICAVYLLEEYWNKGYGWQVMNFAVDFLSRQDYNEVTLWVLKDNQRARRFYEKFGFVFDGTEKEIIIGKPLTEIRYVLNCNLLTV